MTYTESAPGSDPRGTTQPSTQSDGTRYIDHVHEVFRRWLGDHYDLAALDAMVAVAACTHLDGDPPWLLLVSGPGNAKTETVMSLAGVTRLIVSTISSEAALLSGSPKRETTAESTGGLLREVGARGILVVKDFTSILSMNRDLRSQVLAALREIYDGRWDRRVGADGGRVMSWQGRLILVGAVTTAYDSAHAVIASMGDRFALLRLDSANGATRQAAHRQALANVGYEEQMRRDLADAVSQLLHAMDSGLAKVDAAAGDLLGDLANLVTLARTAVERDYKGDVIDAHAPEMPTRFAKMLGQIVRGALAVGMDQAAAVSVAVRVAGDSMPPLRLAILGDVLENPGTNVADVGKRLDRPWSTVNREIDGLHMLGLLTKKQEGETARRYSLSEQVDTDALRVLVTRNVSNPFIELKTQLTDISGEAKTLF